MVNQLILLLLRLRQGWVFSKRTWVFSGIQFTRYFIIFVVVETQKNVSRNSNVILRRPTCGQHSGMAAGHKHRAITFLFFIQVCYIFLMSKCRGESHLGLCMTSALAKKRRCALPTSVESCSQTRFKIGSWHCAAEFSLQVPKSCTDLDQTLFYISTWGTHIEFARKIKMLALVVGLPQPCMPENWPQVCRVKITFELLRTICFVSMTTNSMKCIVNWIPLNTHVCFVNSQPCLINTLKLKKKPIWKCRSETKISLRPPLSESLHIHAQVHHTRTRPSEEYRARQDGSSVEENTGHVQGCTHVHRSG